MMRYSILGNCQTISIADYLNSSTFFSEKFEFLYLPPVHTIDIKEDKGLLDIFANIDLLIYQPVVNENRFGMFTSDNAKSLMKKNAMKICVPSMYYTGYFPTIGSIEGLDGALRGVHDFVIVAGYLSGFKEHEVVNLLTDKFILSRSDLDKFHLLAIQSLKQRENDFQVDIKISTYIEKNYKSIRLFHTFNHPTVQLVDYVCSEILSKLNLEQDVVDIVDKLDAVVAPIYDSVYDSLKLTFKNKPMGLDGSQFSVEFLVNHDYCVYRNNSQEYLREKLLQQKRFIAEYFNLQ